MFEDFAIGLTVFLAFFVLVGVWKAFQKAGEPGWAALVPIYNCIVLLRIAGRPLWWILLLIIPVIGFIVALIVSIDVAHRFGKSTLFGVGLYFLSFVFWPVLGLGDAVYQGA